MKTLLLKADEKSLKLAKDLILDSQLVSFPTETVYGLGANAFDACAVEKIFLAKGRPSDNPLIIHISSLEMLQSFINPIPDVYLALIDNHWPGPLTILLPKPECIPSIVTAGQNTVAIRMPAHPIARRLIELTGFPLAAPSANTSGRPSPTLAQHVFDDLNGKIPLIIDGGACESGVESTVLDGLRQVPAILRPGGLNLETIQDLIGHVDVYKIDFNDEQLEQAPTTPGMKYRHYSPNAIVIVVECSGIQMERIQETYDQCAGKVVGVLLHGEHGHCYKIQHSLGNDLKEIARSLFIKLRELEQIGVEVIIVQGVSDANEGLAIMNRLRKAASKIVE